MILDLLLICLVTGMTSVGFFLATEENNILYFLKKPIIEKLQKWEKEKNFRVSEVNEMEAGDICAYEKDANPYDTQRLYFRQVYNRKINTLRIIFKPIFLCPRCMASLWSILIYAPITMYEYGMETTAITFLPAVFVTVTINCILHNIADI
jgi:hypothetical protein